MWINIRKAIICIGSFVVEELIILFEEKPPCCLLSGDSCGHLPPPSPPPSDLSFSLTLGCGGRVVFVGFRQSWGFLGGADHGADSDPKHRIYHPWGLELGGGRVWFVPIIQTSIVIFEWKLCSSSARMVSTMSYPMCTLHFRRSPPPCCNIPFSCARGLWQALS